MSAATNPYLRSIVIQVQKAFWKQTNRLYALRATISIAFLSIPFIAAGHPYYGVTLSLGALSAALSETDDHPRGRLRVLGITVLSFFISCLAVGLLQHNIWILGTGFLISTVLFILIGGMGERYRAVTFGSIIVGIYAMLGIKLSPDWYWPAILLPGGALFHGLVSMVVLSLNPWRPLNEQLAKGYLSLSKYLETKAKLFPSKKEEQEEVTKELALMNVQVVNALEKIKEVLINYEKEVNNSELMRPYLQRFMMLQSLHERAASTHERYDKLSNKKQRIEVMEGIGEMLRQLAYATQQLADNIITGERYKHPPALDWISKAIDANMAQLDAVNAQSLMLLHHNLHRSHLSLKYLDNVEEGTAIPRLRKDERTAWHRIKAQLTLKHPRMRYAIRLTLSFLIGFVIENALELDKGAWVMLTSLFVSQISYTDTRRRLFERLLGTVTGVVLAILLLQIFTTVAAQLLMMLASVFFFFYWLRSRYSVSVIFITTFVISAFNLISGDGAFTIMIPRILDTLLGALIAFLVIRFLWPGWQYKRLPGLVTAVLKKNLVYFQAIISEYSSGDKDDLTYRIARREAHLAGNELAMAWNSMRLEPKSKQQLLQHAFNFTYLNHALLSYISALGAHRENSSYTLKNVMDVTNQIIALLQKAHDVIETGNSMDKPKITALLVDLKQRIAKCELNAEKQQLRLLYNITGSIAKMFEELQGYLIDKEETLKA